MLFYDVCNTGASLLWSSSSRNHESSSSCEVFLSALQLAALLILKQRLQLSSLGPFAFGFAARWRCHWLQVERCKDNSGRDESGP